MTFEKYSEILTRGFASLDEYPQQKKMARQKVEVLLNGIKTEDTGLISCKAIISHNHRSDFTGACSHFFVSGCAVVWRRPDRGTEVQTMDITSQSRRWWSGQWPSPWLLDV